MLCHGDFLYDRKNFLHFFFQHSSHPRFSYNYQSLTISRYFYNCKSINFIFSLDYKKNILLCATHIYVQQKKFLNNIVSFSHKLFYFYNKIIFLILEMHKHRKQSRMVKSELISGVAIQVSTVQKYVGILPDKIKLSRISTNNSVHICIQG